MSNVQKINHMVGNDIVLFNVRVGTRSFRNFEGRGSEFNTPGSRNFVVFIDDDFAREIESAGAPVNWKPDKYNEGRLRAQMKVHVKYRDRKGNDLTPPKIVLVTRKKRTQLDENDIKLLDRADISNWDMILSMYRNTGNMGPENSVSLKTLYATLNEDELDAMYEDELGGEDSSEAELW